MNHDAKAEIFDIHIPCQKCGNMIPVGCGNYCITCRLRRLNDPVFISMVMPMADYIRSMSDEELARMLMMAHDGEIHIPFCKNKDECFYALDHNKDIKDSECLRCMIDWLKQPAEVDNG